jgi:hypothetical protein
MLYSELSTRTWIVMHPPADRARFATIERGVFLVMERAFARAPPAVSEAMRGVRPRLVCCSSSTRKTGGCAAAWSACSVSSGSAS